MRGVAVGAREAMEGSNTRPNIKVAKPPIFNREVEKVGDFIIVCRLYLRIKLREAIVEEQIQWVLSYVQGGLVNMWKENILEDLKMKEVEFELVEDWNKREEQWKNLYRNSGGQPEEVDMKKEHL